MARGVRLTALLTVALVGGCGSDLADLPVVQRPSLPEVESMLFDTETFPGGGTPPAATLVSPSSHLSHHGVAALTVAVTNVIVAAHLAVPVAAWRAARLSVPVLEEDQWHWRFETTVLGVTYSGDLTGFFEDNDAVFEMRLSSSAGLSDFLWYTGRAQPGGATGVWEFFDPNMPGALAGDIVWSHPSTAVWTLAFTARAGPHEGDQLSYLVNGTTRTMRFFDASEGLTSEIEWDAVTRTGYIEAPNYNNGERACWNTLLQNTSCT